MAADANSISDNRRTSMPNGLAKQEAEEIQIPVPWGHVAGKWWGPKDVQPLICLHGWQDNAGTFDKLASLVFSKIALLAIDLPGHGHSSHLPDGHFYYIFWDGLLLLRRVIKHYKWTKITYRKLRFVPALLFTALPNKLTIVATALVYLGKWWSPREVPPIVALHGRQDNAGTFDNLMPLISTEVSFLCLDMPGHGFSSHLPKGPFYYLYWDGIQLLHRVFMHFEWTKVKILGHSLGGAIGFLYAASYPDAVEALISLDIASPSVRNILKTVESTADQIDRFLKYERLTLADVPCYDYDEMIDIVESAYAGSITRESADVLMRRGMQPAPSPGRHYFSRDPRLKTSMLGMLSLDLVLGYAEKIKCAYLNIRAIPGMRFDHPENYQIILDKIKETAKRFEYHEVAGTHHVHLNEPEKIAPIIRAFLDPHNSRES